MGRKASSHKLMEWTGIDIYVTEAGVFYAHDGDGRRIEAPTLEALKKKIGNGVECNLAGVRFQGYGEDRVERVTVLRITGAGNIIYRDMSWPNERPQRASHWDKIYLRDDVRLAEREQLKKTIDEMNSKLADLMDDWPRITKETAKELTAEPWPAPPKDKGE